MNISYDQHIGIFKNAVSKEDCETIIGFFEENSSFAYDRIESEQHYGHQKRDLSVNMEIDGHEIFVKLSETLAKCFDDYRTEYFSLLTYDNNFDLEPLFKIQKTDLRGGYHMWHYENAPDQCRNRVVVWSLYLNTIDEGGETEYLDQTKRVKPEQGTICLWPAGFTHAHRGNPPLSGSKYIATGWISYK